jgi:trehalose/maltose transport system permease protein
MPANTLRRIVFLLALAAMLAFTVAPFAWQVVTALKPESELARLPPLLPTRPTLQHFSAVLAAPGFLRAGLNSILVALMTVTGVFLVGIPAAYALAKLRLRGAQLILAMLLSLSMFPAVANVAPLYLAAIRLGIRDSIFAVAVAHAVFTLPFAIWIMVDFLQEIPDELYRAARVDGCSHLGVLRHVVLPVALPGLLSVGLLVFIFSWNEFLYAFTLTASEHSRTLPVAIALFPGLRQIPWGEISAAAVLATLPSVALMLVFERRIVSGLTAGAVKG